VTAEAFLPFAAEEAEPTAASGDAPAMALTSTDRLWEEIVYIAYYLHWSFDSILELDHLTRARVIEEIGNINLRLSVPPDGDALAGWEG
jgi:hypothetical protein